MGIKLQDLEPEEIARFQAGPNRRDNGYIVHEGTIYEILGIVSGKVKTIDLDGSFGPDLPEDDCEVLEVPKRPLKKVGGRWQES